MSSTIEQKVVEMRFDNSNFEKNVSDSMSTLDRLKEKLENSTSGNAFAELGKAANNLNFDGVAGGVQTITDKFSILEEIASGALRNIGAHIQEYLVSSLKHVTLDNVIGGWGRYAQKTESMQTILSAIADEDYGDISKIDYVEGLLEKLAWFSDETSYNFTDMTDNISKFTAAGLDLDKSTNAMIGIANWAANAGQNASTASRAMYQLSQAMGTGGIRLMDWKSIETANMATKEVKNLLIDYGKLFGTVKTDALGDYVEQVTAKGIKRIEVSSQNFRETLKEGWLTADIFTAAMAEYSEYSNALYEIIQNPKNKKIDTASELMRYFDKAIEKSKETGKAIEDIMMEDYEIDIMVETDDGSLRSAIENVTELGIRAMKSAQQARTWAQAVESVSDASSTQWSFIFERIFGNVEEATILFTDLAEYMWDKFVGPLVAIKDVLTDWKELGGRDLLFVGDDSALSNIMTAIDTIQEAVGDGIVRVFPPKTAEDLYELTERFRDFTERLILSDETAAQLSDTAERLAKAFKMVGSFVSSIGQVMSAGFGKVLSIAGQLRTKILDVFSLKSLKDNNGFFSAMDPNLSLSRYKDALDSISSVFSTVKTKLLDFIDGLRIGAGASQKITDILTGLRSVITLIGKGFGVLNDVLVKIDFKKIAEFLGDGLLKYILYIPSAIGKAVTSFEEFLSTSSRGQKIFSTISNVIKGVVDFIRGFSDAMNEVKPIGRILDGISSFFNSLFKTISESSAFQYFLTLFDKFIERVNEFTSKYLNYDTGRWFKNLFNSDDVEEGTKKVGTFGEKVGSVFSGILTAVKWVSEKISGLFTSIKTFVSDFGVLDFAKNIFSKVGDMFRTIVGGLGESIAGIKETDSLTTKLKKAFSVIRKVIDEIVDIIVKLLPGVAIGAGGIAVGSGLSKLTDFISSPFKDLFGDLSKFLNSIKDSISGFMEASKIKEIGTSVKGIIGALAIFVAALAVSVYLLSSVDNPDQISGIFWAFAGFIAELFSAVGGLIALGLANKKQTVGLIKISAFLTAMGISVGLIGAAIATVVKAIDGKDSKTVETAIWSIIGLIGEFTAASILMSKYSGKSKTSFLGIIGVALAVKMVAGVVEELGKLSLGELEKGVGAVAALSLIAFLLGQVGSGNKQIGRAGITLLLISASMLILSNIVKTLGELNVESLTKGTLALTALSLIAILLGQVGSGNKQIALAGATLLLISASMLILTSVVKQLGEMKQDDVVQGLAALAAMAGIVGILSIVASANKTLILASAALLVMAGAMAIISGIILAMAAFSKTEGGGEALATAIILLTAALGGLVIAAYLVGPAAAPLLAFGAAVAVLAAGLVLLSAGIVGLVAAFSLLSASTVTLSLVFTTTLTAICESIVNSREAIKEALVSLLTMALDTFIATMDSMIEAIIEFALRVLTAIEENGPILLEKVYNILVMIWDCVVRFFEEQIIPDLTYLLSLIIESIFSLLDQIRERLVEFISSAIDDIFGLLDQIKDRIVEFVKEVISDIDGLITDVIDLIVGSVQKFIDAALEVMQAFADGIIDGIKLATKATEDVIKAVVESIVSLTDTVFQGIVDLINGLADSIERHSTDFWNAVKRLCSAIINAFLGIFNDENGENSIKKVGTNLMEGLKNGITAGYETIKTSVSNVASGVINWFKNVFGIQSPSRVMRQFGEYLDEGLAIGIKDASGMPENAAKAASENVVDAMSEALLNIDSMLGNDDLTPTITPVMDLSQIQNGFGMMSGMFDSYGNYSLDAAMAARYNPYVDADGKPIENPIKTMGEQVMSLQEKFDEMLVKLGKLRVVLDSGTLVGELVEPMDEALGRRAVYVGRSM